VVAALKGPTLEVLPNREREPLILGMLRRVRIRAGASDQALPFRDISRLDHVRIETGAGARVADSRLRVATEGDQPELRRREPLSETPAQLYPIHAGIDRSTTAHSGWNVSAAEWALGPSAATATS
jgi:hypothetical protein